MAAAVVLVALLAFLRFTRIGLVIRAGVENRAMVTALGIDVRRAFTLVFAIGGAAAALAGVLAGVSFGIGLAGAGHLAAHLRVHRGRHRRHGSIVGSAAAAVAVGLVQQFVNYYAPGLGDVCVVALLAIVLLVRPQGLAEPVTGGPRHDPG